MKGFLSRKQLVYCGLLFFLMLVAPAQIPAQLYDPGGDCNNPSHPPPPPPQYCGKKCSFLPLPNGTVTVFCANALLGQDGQKNCELTDENGDVVCATSGGSATCA